MRHVVLDSHALRAIDVDPVVTGLVLTALEGGCRLIIPALCVIDASTYNVNVARHISVLAEAAQQTISVISVDQTVISISELAAEHNLGGDLALAHAGWEATRSLWPIVTRAGAHIDVYKRMGCDVLTI